MRSDAKYVVTRIWLVWVVACVGVEVSSKQEGPRAAQRWISADSRLNSVSSTPGSPNMPRDSRT